MSVTQILDNRTFHIQWGSEYWMCLVLVNLCQNFDWCQDFEWSIIHNVVMSELLLMTSHKTWRTKPGARNLSECSVLH